MSQRMSVFVGLWPHISMFVDLWLLVIILLSLFTCTWPSRLQSRCVARGTAREAAGAAQVMVGEEVFAWWKTCS